LRLVALVVFLVALALALRTQWKGVAPLLGRTSPLAAALAAVLAGIFATFLCWRAVLSGFAVSLPMPAAMRVFFLGQLGKFADEEHDVPLALAARHWYRAALAGAVTAFGLLGWVLYDALGLASAQLAVAVAGLAGVVVIIASSVPMWNQILRYARGQPIGAGRWGRASRTRRS
jgi:hypothetical protein